MRRESEFRLMPRASYLAPNLCRCHLLGFFLGLLDGADHVESLLWDIVVLTLDNFLEGTDGVFQFDISPGDTGKLFGNMERLREKTLHLAGARDGQLIVFGKLVHAENRDDVLQIFVTLQDQLHRAGNVIVFLADHVWIENARSRIERIHCRVNAQLGNLPGQNRGRVEMGESGRRRRVGQVVGRDVNCLNRGNRTFASRGDALLQLAQVGRQRRLITDGRRHAAEQGRHFGVCLGETENIIQEQQHVAPFVVTEVFRESQRGQSDAGARSGRLIHLTVDQRGFVDNARLFHFEPKIVAFTSTFANAAEDRITAVFLGDVVDQLHQNNRFADAGTAEQADFTAARIGGEQIDDFYAGLKRLNLGFLIDEFWRRPVNWRKLLRIDWSTFIHRLADHVYDPSESSLAHRHADTRAGIHNIHAAHQTFSGIHGDAAHAVLTQVLRHFDH